jgi:hypothetical protein
MSGKDVQLQADQSQASPDEQELSRTKRLKKRFKEWLDSWKPSKKTSEEIIAENKLWWFLEHLPSVWEQWEERIDNYLLLNPRTSRATAAEVSAACALKQALTEFNKLDRDIEKSLARSNVITASAAMIAALVVGVFTLVATQKVAFSAPMLACAATLMMISFLLNMWSMRPAFRRAISEPFVDMTGWSVMVVDAFSEWAMLTYSCRSRQQIVTRYKLLHSASITIFVIGVVLLWPAFLWPYIVR